MNHVNKDIFEINIKLMARNIQKNHFNVYNIFLGANDSNFRKYYEIRLNINRLRLDFNMKPNLVYEYSEIFVIFYLF